MKNKIKINSKLKKHLLAFQRNEISEHFIYKKLAKSSKDKNNKNVLKQISDDELKHYNVWKKYTQKEVKPNKVFIIFTIIIVKIFGLTFGTKLMEKGEAKAQISYKKIIKDIPQARSIMQEENEHELKLLNILNERKLKYIGSIVLGLNDALIELTGALAGFTFAFQNSRLIGITGVITGIAASLSMAASEYLSQETEDSSNNSLRAAIYTGITYLTTVILLILPYFLISNPFVALAVSLGIGIFIIFFFTFYTSIAQDSPFLKRFFKVSILSIGIAGFTFIIGIIIKKYLGVEI